MPEILRTWLDGFARLKDLVDSICPFRLTFGGSSERSTDLVCPSVWHCGRMRVSHFWCQMELILIQTEWSKTGYMFVPGRPKGLEFEKDTWREVPHIANFNSIIFQKLAKVRWFQFYLFIYLFLKIWLNRLTTIFIKHDFLSWKKCWKSF